MILGGFSVKFIADFVCEISWVGGALQRDSVGFFLAFKGCFMRVLMVSFCSCFSVSKDIVRIFLG